MGIKISEMPELPENLDLGDSYVPVALNGRKYKRSVGHRRTSAETAAGVTPVNYAGLVTPIRDISRYVSDNTGATDVRAEFQAAIDVSRNELVVPDGTYLIDGSLNPKSGTGIFGNGQNTVLKLADGADVPLIKFAATNLNYVDVHLRDFSINGNKANQTSTGAHGIYLTNVTGTSGLIARHRISRLYIFNTKGDGMQLGFAMRGSRIDDVLFYMCDQHGLQTVAFSDSIIRGIDAGQSGLHGIFINGGGALHLESSKSWFSGRLGDGAGGTGGTNGHGYFIRNASQFIGRNLESQENEGHGFRVIGDGSAITNVSLEGFVSDGDNKEGGNTPGATAWAAISLDNVEESTFRGRVSRFPTAQGKVQYAVTQASVEDCTIDLDVDADAVHSWFVPNVFSASNNVRINRSREGITTHGDDAATLVSGAADHVQVWNTPLAADRAITLDDAHTWKGAAFHIVRTAAATGAFNLNVGTGPLKALSAGEWCKVMFDGSAWALVAYGSL